MKAFEVYVESNLDKDFGSNPTYFGMREKNIPMTIPMGIAEGTLTPVRGALESSKVNVYSYMYLPLDANTTEITDAHRLVNEKALDLIDTEIQRCAGDVETVTYLNLRKEEVSQLVKA